MLGTIVVGDGPRRYAVRRQEVPDVPPEHVLLRIRCANICGSDLKLWQKGSVPPGIGTGHEFVGEIIQLGEKVCVDSNGESVCVGDRVIAPYFETCGKCRACISGAPENCEEAYAHRDVLWTSWPYFHCGFASHYMLLPLQHFYKVPPDIHDEIAASVNCALSQVFGCLKKQLAIRKGETLLIQGCGGLGLYAIAIAHVLGAKVVAIDRGSRRLELAKRFGAALTVNMEEFPRLVDRVDIIREFTSGEGVDKAMEVCGVPFAFEEGLHHLRVGGRYAIIGVNMLDQKADITIGRIVRKSLTILGVVRYDPQVICDAMQFIQQNREKYMFGEIGGECFALEDINKAMEKMEKHQVIRARIIP